MQNIKHELDATANDSSKDFTVPDGEVWLLDWAHVILISTATAGNRQVVMGVYDESDALRMDMHAGTTQAASLTRHYSFQTGVYRETAFVNGEILIAIPERLVMPSGWYFRVYDSAAIAAAADDMTVSYQVTKLRGN